MAVYNLAPPAGSQNAGAMQMQAWANFGRAIGEGLKNRREGKLEEQDLARLLHNPQEVRDLAQYSSGV